MNEEKILTIDIGLALYTHLNVMNLRDGQQQAENLRQRVHTLLMKEFRFLEFDTEILLFEERKED